MNANDEIAIQLREGLNRISLIKQVRDSVRVTTHCMYPSNGLVNVTLRGGRETVVVSDEGGAISEAASAGINKVPSDQVLTRIVSPQGLFVKKGIVMSPPVAMSTAHVATILVANGSKQIAEWLYHNANLRVVRDFKEAVAQVLRMTFPSNLSHDVAIHGVRKAHKFANVVSLENEKKLIVDAVTPEISSISTRVIQHLDVHQKNDPDIIQRIIYDDEVEWTTDNLSMLHISEVPVLAFSKSRERLSDIGRGRSFPFN